MIGEIIVAIIALIFGTVLGYIIKRPKCSNNCPECPQCPQCPECPIPPNCPPVVEKEPIECLLWGRNNILVAGDNSDPKSLAPNDSLAFIYFIDNPKLVEPVLKTFKDEALSNTLILARTSSIAAATCPYRASADILQTRYGFADKIVPIYKNSASGITTALNEHIFTLTPTSINSQLFTNLKNSILGTGFTKNVKITSQFVQ